MIHGQGSRLSDYSLVHRPPANHAGCGVRKHFPILLAGLFGVTACRSPKVTEGIPNFARIPGTRIYRGGQPTQSGWAFVAALGVHHVVKLNRQSEGSDMWAVALNLDVTDIPLPPSDAGELFQRPALADVQRAAALLQRWKEAGIFIHCSRGEDRTGLVIGCWRIWYCGWSKTEAYAEMRRNGFHPALIGLREFWKHVTAAQKPGPIRWPTRPMRPVRPVRPEPRPS